MTFAPFAAVLDDEAVGRAGVRTILYSQPIALLVLAEEPGLAAADRVAVDEPGGLDVEPALVELGRQRAGPMAAVQGVAPLEEDVPRLLPVAVPAAVEVEAVLPAVDGPAVPDGQTLDVAGVGDVEAAGPVAPPAALETRARRDGVALVVEDVREAAALARAGEVEGEAVVVAPLDRAAAERQVPQRLSPSGPRP